jgi:hypothetical protein
MIRAPLFKGLIANENGEAVAVSMIGNESFYVVNDAGFLRHIPAEQVDRQVMKIMLDQIKGNEDLLAEQAAKALGQEDIFSRALLNNQIKNMDQQFEQIFQNGIPEEGLAYMGLMGFKVIINYHGEVLDVIQPSKADPGEE